MRIEFDSANRQKTLEERGIDFCNASKVSKACISLQKTTEWTTVSHVSSLSAPYKSGLWWRFGQPEAMYAELFP